MTNMLEKLDRSTQGLREEPGAALKTAAMVMLAGLATRQVVVFGWRALHGENPPRDPSRPDVAWPTAVGWTAAVGVTVGLARLFTRRVLSR